MYQHDRKKLAADVRACRDGEITFAEFIGRHEWILTWLYHLTLKILGNSHDAEDAVNDILLIVFLNLQQLRDAKVFKSWVRTIANRHSWGMSAKLKKLAGQPADDHVLEIEGREGDPATLVMSREAEAAAAEESKKKTQQMRGWLDLGHVSAKQKWPKKIDYMEALGMPQGPRGDYATVATELELKGKDPAKNLRAEFGKYKSAMREFLAANKICSIDIELALDILINGEPTFDD